MQNYLALLGIVWFMNGTAAFGQNPIRIHPKAEACPSKFSGPFVHIPNGGILTLSAAEAHASFDKGKTWESYPAIPAATFAFGDLSIDRTKDGVIVAIFCNQKEVRSGAKGWGKGTPAEWQIPVYSIRSTDNGKTWSAPLAIQRDWVGALRAMVVLQSGRIVIATMAIQPWEHVIPVYYSDDQGKRWTKTQTITMEGSKINDHDGAMEPKLIERADHSLFMLIRTTKGTFFQSLSKDGGLTWSKPESSGIQNNNSFGELARLQDGRLVLVWNRDDKYPPFGYAPDPKDWPLEEQSYSWIKRRNKLSLAISADDGKTWTDPVVVASTDDEKVWIAYTVFFEVEPGVFWINTGQGDVHMQVREKDLY
ncbi:MAG: exo-alpha-sialidase [Pirellulales bacterium]|nr:exo-alpha-sialidase [Pirellulales bacterium]